MRSEKGFSLIEVVIAMALVGIIAVAFFTALSTASKTVVIADEQTTAESLARRQMEYIKNQPYTAATSPDWEVTYLKISDIPTSYEIWSVDRNAIQVTTIQGVPWDSETGQPAASENGLQRTKLIIKRLGKELITLEDYKAER
ncbi:MAG: type II secretion system protein [Dehalococcoidales bacterium]|nr:type II secretion system protein [Dehalococcoidales bacterium]